jgi:hypothetical protein
MPDLISFLSRFGAVTNTVLMLLMHCFVYTNVFSQLLFLTIKHAPTLFCVHLKKNNVQFVGTVLCINCCIFLLVFVVVGFVNCNCFLTS